MGKVTLPLIYVLETGSGSERALIINAIKSENRLPYLADIQAIIESTGAIDYTIAAAQKHAVRANAMLTEYIPDSPYREALVALGNFAVERRY